MYFFSDYSMAPSSIFNQLSISPLTLTFTLLNLNISPYVDSNPSTYLLSSWNNILATHSKHFFMFLWMESISLAFAKIYISSSFERK